jgi:hypothetical protein
MHELRIPHERSHASGSNERRDRTIAAVCRSNTRMRRLGRVRGPVLTFDGDEWDGGGVKTVDEGKCGGGHDRTWKHLSKLGENATRRDWPMMTYEVGAGNRYDLLERSTFRYETNINY